MTDKERLEMIKHDFEEVSKMGGFINDFDTQWLIEKVERLEKEINFINQMSFIKVNSELREKVEIQEKALEDIYSIAKFSRPDLVPNEVREIARKALWKV